MCRSFVTTDRALISLYRVKNQHGHGMGWMWTGRLERKRLCVKRARTQHATPVVEPTALRCSAVVVRAIYVP